MRKGDGERFEPRRASRGEVAILVPVALLLLVLVSVFTLFSYRNAIGLLVEEERQEALRGARRLAADAARGPILNRSRLRESGGMSAVLLSSEGAVLESVGPAPPDPLLPDLEPGREAVLGPGGPVGPTVAAFLPLGQGRWLRVDREARVLAAQVRSLGILTAVVLGADGAISLILLLFVGRLLAPFESLMARAREARVPGPGGGREVDHLLATFEEALDLLQTKRAAPEPEEEEIAALERTLVPSLESGVMLLDPGGRVLALNAVGAELLSAEPPEAPTPAEELLAGQPAVLRAVRRAVGEERRIQREECVVETEDGPRDLGLTVHPLRRQGAGGKGGREGAVRGYLALFVDLTEVRRRREEVQLSESLQRLGALAGGIAHEMRNSLATLKGWIQLMERDLRGGAAPGGEYLDEVRREAEHLHRVLEDFLSFARPGSVRSEELDAVALAERAAADPVLSRWQVEVRGGGDRAPRILGDPQLLERAIRNLLYNATEASRETGGTRIEVEVTALGREVEIAVSDRGAGVPPELRDRLFVPFASGRPDGVGLGLALVRRIVDLHGGRVRVEERSGGGTVVRLRLSAVESATKGNERRGEESEERDGPSDVTR